MTMLSFLKNYFTYELWIGICITQLCKWTVTRQFLVWQLASFLWNWLFLVGGENLVCCNSDFLVVTRPTHSSIHYDWSIPKKLKNLIQINLFLKVCQPSKKQSWSVFLRPFQKVHCKYSFATIMFKKSGRRKEVKTPCNCTLLAVLWCIWPYLCS